MEEFRLSEVQLFQYLDKVHYFSNVSPEERCLPSVNLPNLNLLMKLHIQNIPYGNLSFHYFHTTSPTAQNTDPTDPKSTRGVSIHPRDLFTKLVVNHRDGYCFEHNLLFYYVLKSLNFSIFKVLANCVNRQLYGEVGRKVEVDGIEHLALIVSLNTTEYLVDVGYVGTSNFFAIPINTADPKTTKDTDGEYVALSDGSKLQIIRKYLPDLEGDKELVEPHFHVRNFTLSEKFSKYQSEEKFEFQPLFFFRLNPCTWKDVQQLNLLLTLQKENVFYSHMFLKKTCSVCPFDQNLTQGTLSLFDNQVKYVQDELKGGELITVKRFLNSKEERLQVYKQWFGIRLHEMDQEYLPEGYLVKG